MADDPIRRFTRLLAEAGMNRSVVRGLLDEQHPIDGRYPDEAIDGFVSFTRSDIR